MTVNLGSYYNGRLLLDTNSSHLTAGGIVSPSPIPLVATAQLAAALYLGRGTSAIVAALPFKVGGARQTIAALATVLATNPDFSTR